MYKRTLHGKCTTSQSNGLTWLRLNAELIISIRNYFFRVCLFFPSRRFECVCARHTFCFLRVFCFVALTSSSTTTAMPAMTTTTVWLVSHSLSGRVQLFGWLIFFSSHSCCCCSLARSHCVLVHCVVVCQKLNIIQQKKTN